MKKFNAYVDREGSTVQICVGPTPTTERKEDTEYFVFGLNLNSDNFAELLYRWVRDRTHDLLSEERRRWYSKGYKDGRAKKRKTKWFPSSFEHTNPNEW